MDTNTEKYKKIFISETEEKIRALNDALLSLEKNPGDSVRAFEGMRATHTIKSSAASMNFMEMSHLAHAIENYFEQIRTEKLILSIDKIQALYYSADVLKASLNNIIKNGTELPTSELVSNLKNDTLEKIKKTAEGTLPIEPIHAIKVDVKVLGSLMSLTEELIISEMKMRMVLQPNGGRLTEVDVNELKIEMDRLERITNEMQFSVNEAHLVPLGQLFEQTPRMIRDLASGQGKKIEYRTEGQNITLDRVVVDRLGEPIFHLLRNAVDHGVEKNGQIILKAERLQNIVRITVSSIGKPIDWGKVLEVAVKKGLIKESEKDRHAKDINLLFDLSTKEAINETSGRGVGLSIVKSTIESLGGSVSVNTHDFGTDFILQVPLTIAVIQALLVRSNNNTFAIPFAQVESIVSVPIENIRTVLDKEVALVKDEDYIMVRLGNFFNLPIIKPEGILLQKNEIQLKRETDVTMIIASQSENMARLGVVVDEVYSQQNIVVKPLKGVLQKTKGFAGVTLLGGGAPALIVDINSLNTK